jgi:hypothetical protein
MKRVGAFTKVSVAVFAVAVALLSSAQAQVTGRTFRVTVTSSNLGAPVTDCFRFDVPNAGDLTIDQLGQVLTYRHGQLDTVDTHFQAVSRTGQLFAIMFSGDASGAPAQLTGEGVTEFGETFTFSGPDTGPSTSPSLCVPAAGPASAPALGR